MNLLTYEVQFCHEMYRVNVTSLPLHQNLFSGDESVCAATSDMSMSVRFVVFLYMCCSQLFRYRSFILCETFIFLSVCVCTLSPDYRVFGCPTVPFYKT